jgi:hypothetical protein
MDHELDAFNLPIYIFWTNTVTHPILSLKTIQSKIQLLLKDVKYMSNLFFGINIKIEWKHFKL